MTTAYLDRAAEVGDLVHVGHLRTSINLQKQGLPITGTVTSIADGNLTFKNGQQESTVPTGSVKVRRPEEKKKRKLSMDLPWDLD